MTRYGFLLGRGSCRRRLGPILASVLVVGCSLTGGPDDKPSEARVRVEGSSPHPLSLIVATNFYEQLNLETGARSVVLVSSDTSEISLPHDRAVDLGETGSVYVELLNPLVATATVRMRVDLDSGQNPYDQSATLSDRASLIYYFLFQ